MKQQQTPTQALLLVMHLKAERDDRNDLYGRFEAYVQAYNPQGRYDDGPMSYLSSYDSLFSRLGMTAYYGVKGIAEGWSYGFEYGYESEHKFVTSTECKRFSKGLKQLETKLEKQTAAQGRPQSLGQEVVRVMHAIGCTRACVRLPNKDGAQWRQWREITSMEDIRFHIDHTVAEFREKHCTEQTEAA